MTAPLCKKGGAVVFVLKRGVVTTVKSVFNYR